VNPAGITRDQQALLTLAAIRSVAQVSVDSPLRAYVLSLTDDLILPKRGSDQ